MKAVILSAGQGKRLLPLTADCPKCILPVRGRTLIEWQIDELAKCGVKQVCVVLGFRADKVERLLHQRYSGRPVQTVYNPAYAQSDNLVSCWTANSEMNSDFILLNGDTLFEAPLLQHLLASPGQPVTVAVSHKRHYDADDMKVELDGSRLVRIGKDLLPDQVDGESIGIILFRGEGPQLFRTALETALRNPSAQKKWYLAVIDAMARSMPVWTCSIKGYQWCEVDYNADLEHAERVVSACGGPQSSGTESCTCQANEVSLG